MAAAERVKSHRRYCFLKYHMARNTELGDPDTWDAKRRSLPGTPIPSTMPAGPALAAAGYLVIEEIEGANATELINAGLTAPQAAAVLAALET